MNGHKRNAWYAWSCLLQTYCHLLLSSCRHSHNTRVHRPHCKLLAFTQMYTGFTQHKGTHKGTRASLQTAVSHTANAGDLWCNQFSFNECTEWLEGFLHPGLEFACEVDWSLETSYLSLSCPFLCLFFKGNVSHEEMARTFNCGIGGVLIVSKTHTQEVVDRLTKAGEKASVIGVVEKRTGIVVWGNQHQFWCNLCSEWYVS